MGKEKWEQYWQVFICFLQDDISTTLYQDSLTDILGPKLSKSSSASSLSQQARLDSAESGGLWTREAWGDSKHILDHGEQEENKLEPAPLRPYLNRSFPVQQSCPEHLENISCEQKLEILEGQDWCKASRDQD